MLIFLSQPTFDLVLRGLILAAVALLWVVILIRINGLRTLSKMTSFDFLMTVAMGSLLAGAAQADSWSKFAQPMVAMVGLTLAQYLAARVRKSSGTLEDAMQNEPRLLMRDGKIIESALKETRVARSDIYAKLREANATEIDKVRAVVLETTGDVSVLHGDALDERVLSGVSCPE